MKQQKTDESGMRIHVWTQEEQPDIRPDNFRKHQDRKMKLIIVLALVLFLLFLASMLFLVPYHQFRFDAAWFFSHVKERFSGFYLYLFGTSADSFGITIIQYLAVIVAGASLAACGCVFQGSFHNVLAGPSTMGTMSGGTLGAILYLVCCVSSDGQVFIGNGSSVLWVLAGCFGGVALILGISMAAGHGRLSAEAMILSGTVFSAFISNIVMVVQYYIILKNPNDTRIEMLQTLLLGSFDGITTWQTLRNMALPILACLVFVLLIAGRLNLLALGETEAVSMGVDVAKYRNLMTLVGTVLTAMVVAYCGRIGFLGFMIPLVGRKLAGPDLRRLLPVSMLLGAILLVLVFDVAYVVGLTGYLNLVTSTIGSIVMIITLIKRRGGQQGESGTDRAS